MTSICGNSDMFTPMGKQEVVVATEKLQDYKFDFWVRY